jgi:GH25 family lysozyme M1 (1,4-beta-N-acetylmuramidase)
MGGYLTGWRTRERAVLAAGCVLAAVLAVSGLGVRPATAVVSMQGMDVSDHQTSTNWATVASGGEQFAYIKATEGLHVSNTLFAAQYDGAYRVGLIRGAYHFALPDMSSGAAQASFFATHGGGWSADGRTLPGALDIEANPYGSQCYGLSPGAMVAWIAGFIRTYHALTSRWAVVYTTRNWWSACTGGYSGFAGEDPLWVASYAAAPGQLPAGWRFYTFWQYAPGGPSTGDQDVFNGPVARLKILATGRL